MAVRSSLSFISRKIALTRWIVSCSASRWWVSIIYRAWISAAPPNTPLSCRLTIQQASHLWLGVDAREHLADLKRKLGICMSQTTNGQPLLLSPIMQVDRFSILDFPDINCSKPILNQFKRARHIITNFQSRLATQIQNVTEKGLLFNSSHEWCWSVGRWKVPIAFVPFLTSRIWRFFHNSHLFDISLRRPAVVRANRILSPLHDIM